MMCTHLSSLKRKPVARKFPIQFLGLSSGFLGIGHSARPKGLEGLIGYFYHRQVFYSLYIVLNSTLFLPVTGEKNSVLEEFSISFFFYFIIVMIFKRKKQSH